MATVEPRPRRARPTLDLSRVRAAQAELERLFVEHGERVQAICAGILGNRHEAEDAAQQVFVAALHALRGGTVPRDEGAWLATIARHESWARARYRAPVALHEELPDVRQEDPAAAVVRRAELAEAWQTIADLPPAQREALLLREVRGLGYEELAENLQLSQGSVRSLLSRARHTLRMRIEQGAASLAGAQWLNLLTRLFGDTSNPALSSATRTAAVGLGALAITGGAIVAPTLTGHPHAHAETVAARSTPSAGLVAATSRPFAAPGEQSNLGPRRRHHSTAGSDDRGQHSESGGTSGDQGGRDDGGSAALSGEGSGGGDGSPAGSGSVGSTSGQESSGGRSHDGSSGSSDGGSGSTGSRSEGDAGHGGGGTRATSGSGGESGGSSEGSSDSFAGSDSRSSGGVPSTIVLSATNGSDNGGTSSIDGSGGSGSGGGGEGP